MLLATAQNATSIKMSELILDRYTRAERNGQAGALFNGLKVIANPPIRIDPRYTIFIGVEHNNTEYQPAIVYMTGRSTREPISNEVLKQVPGIVADVLGAKNVEQDVAVNVIYALAMDD
jgi:hypothetical protein